MIAIRDRKLMDYLVAGLEDDGISKKFERNKSVMALYAGRMEDVIVGAMPVQTFYLAHCGKQYGDLMSDPEVNFFEDQRRGLPFGLQKRLHRQAGQDRLHRKRKSPVR